jgi:spore maturation protein SpmB
MPQKSQTAPPDVGFGAVLSAALPRAWRTIRFLVRLIVPISLGVGLLRWSGMLARIGSLFAPAMAVFHLPGEAGVALLSGWLGGIYAMVGAMAVLPLSGAQVTVLCAMALVAHNLIVECSVQDKAGTPWWWMLLVRLAGSALVGMVVAWSVDWLQSIHAPALWLRFAPATSSSTTAEAESLAAFISGWGRQALKLVIKLVIIVTAMMIGTEWIRAKGILARLEIVCRPFLRFFGLSDHLAYLWLTAQILGVAFGSGLLIEEMRQRPTHQPRQVRDLHTSIGLSHSVLEDTIVLASVGASIFWIIVPRILLAAAAVRILRPLPSALRAAGWPGPARADRKGGIDE